MELSNKLKEQGWHFTENGIKKLTTTAGNDERKIISTAMDMDFRDIAGGALPSKREETIPGRIVLQLQKTRNISAPKSNEESKAAPKFLQLDLSDGQTTIRALELEPVPVLSLDVPPGTKIFFKAERLQLMQGYLVLRPTELQILGGKVEALVKKWEFARTTQLYARMGHRQMNSSSGGPPPWIPFGQKMENKDALTTDRNFKSLQAATEKDKDSKENEEFNTMRSEAIAEATKAGSKKIFGGGGQQILDHNVKKILEKGYTDDEAKQALRATNNNLERALYNLKRRRESNSSRSTQGATSAPNKGGRNSIPRETGNKRGAATAKEEAAAAKPAGNVSLFDFLTEKLPANSDITTANTTKSTVPSTNVSQSNQNAPSTSANSKFIKSKPDAGKLPYNASNKQNEPNSTRPKFENNISSSFAANRTSTSSQQNERDSRDSRDERGRYSNTRGGGKSGRGGYNNSSYKPNNKTYEDDSRTKPENDYYSQRGGGGASGGNYNANNRNNRNSYERSQPPARNNTNSNTNKDRNTHEETFNKFENKRNNNQNNQKSNRANDRYGNTSDKNYDRNRYNQSDNSRTQEGANRSQNNYNSSAKTATTQATTNAEATTTMPKSTSNISKNGNNNSGNNSDFNSNMNKLVDATAKIKIDKSREQGKTQSQQSVPPHQQHNKHQHNSQNFSQQQQTYNPSTGQSQQNHQQQQQQQQPQTVISHFVPAQYVQQPIPTSSPNQNAGNYTQLPYDPSKIIGFQNKQANDFAMSLLKSQGLPNNIPNAPQPHQQQQQTVVPPMQPPSPFAANTFVVPNPQTNMPPTPQATATQFGMVPGDSWLWKIGDLCMAKYWDDGRYYEAEITAVSNKTCVVFFLGYGNHEEVLKSDCLPITDVNNRPINSYNPMLQQQHQTINIAPVPAGAAPPPIPTSQRYRYERQMYVPPHKRKN
ncbi:tudor domain-containing protein 3 [Teleopsis dalmanni]|uniref:tudor domain-containing protein 3 n=1 Tax=Teleopsis dalmanni TaxID=139649 RepID=UPI0018CFAC2C|nr:tudor domain-containing protein 3 [Teleopsis dalmanni]